MTQQVLMAPHSNSTFIPSEAALDFPSATENDDLPDLFQCKDSTNDFGEGFNRSLCCDHESNLDPDGVDVDEFLSMDIFDEEMASAEHDKSCEDTNSQSTKSLDCVPNSEYNSSIDSNVYHEGEDLHDIFSLFGNADDKEELDLGTTIQMPNKITSSFIPTSYDFPNVTSSSMVKADSSFVHTILPSSHMPNRPKPQITIPTPTNINSTFSNSIDWISPSNHPKQNVYVMNAISIPSGTPIHSSLPLASSLNSVCSPLKKREPDVVGSSFHFNPSYTPQSIGGVPSLQLNTGYNQGMGVGIRSLNPMQTGSSEIFKQDQAKMTKSVKDLISPQLVRIRLNQIFHHFADQYSKRMNIYQLITLLKQHCLKPSQREKMKLNDGMIPESLFGQNYQGKTISLDEFMKSFQICNRCTDLKRKTQPRKSSHHLGVQSSTSAMFRKELMEDVVPVIVRVMPNCFEGTRVKSCEHFQWTWCQGYDVTGNPKCKGTNRHDKCPKYLANCTLWKHRLPPKSKKTSPKKREHDSSVGSPVIRSIPNSIVLQKRAKTSQ